MRSASGCESLTAAELEVARFVAAGMTNQQIAARLSASPRTVPTHVAHVFRKLDVARRSGLGAEAARWPGLITVLWRTTRLAASIARRTNRQLGTQPRGVQSPSLRGFA